MMMSERSFKVSNDVQVDPLPKSLLENDPASDNFTHYLDPQYDNMAVILLGDMLILIIRMATRLF
ncbi:MAG: hypothetical protein R2836_06910 [Chitinophagales bacterium]